ncbi:hypothetical protein PGIGA_G00052480 [Pangasianodon gigas]|uniref:Uncharacterized protein n=1 Tax=Pangasianodon gigas TaxID=30993 RepID=A0ACC5X3X1_PANGG|nr:hypothetical protein [Pangasianodon gigas]
MMTYLIVFGDVVFTLVIVAIVYRCAQKKAGTAAPQRATQPRQARGQARAPPPPDPDYQVKRRCVELDAMMTYLIVFGDVVFTLVIVAIVYRCAQKKAGTAAPQRATQPRQARGQARAPPPPDPDYQPLNQATRSNDVYAQANRR